MSHLTNLIIERVTLGNDQQLHQKLLDIAEYKQMSLPGRNLVKGEAVVGRVIDRGALLEQMMSSNPMAAAHKVDELCGEIVEELGVAEEEQYDQAEWLADNCEQVLAEIDSRRASPRSPADQLRGKLWRALLISLVAGFGAFFLLHSYLLRPWWLALPAAVVVFLVLYFVQVVNARTSANLIDPKHPLWAEEFDDPDFSPVRPSSRRALTKEMMQVLELAEAYLQSRACGLAKPETEKALSIARQLRDPDAIRYCHDALGQALLGLKQYESAQHHFERAMRIARMRGDNTGEFAALSGFGESQGLQHDHESALSTFEQALEVAKRDNQVEIVEQALVKIATAQSFLSRHGQSVSSFKAAAEIAQRRGDKNKYSFYLSAISRGAAAAGNEEEALEVSERVLEMARDAGNRSAEAATLMNIGVHYRSLSRHDQALKSLESALEIAREMIEERSEVFNPTQRQSESIMSAIEEDFNQAERTRHNRLITNIFSNLAGVYTDLSDYDNSLEYSLQALRVAEDLGDKDLTMRALRGVGISYGRREDYARAIEYYEQALELAEQQNSLSYTEWCLGILGVTHGRLAQYDQGIEYLQRALPLARNLGNAYTKVCLFDLGELHYLKGANQQAYECLTESMNLTESVRAGIETERARISLAESHAKLAELTVLTCLRLGKETEAFEYAERGKSRALIDLLGSSRINPRDHGDQELLREAEHLRQRIELLRRNLMESAVTTNGAEERRGNERTVLQLRETEEHEQEIWQKIRRSNPEFVSLQQVQPMNLEDVRQILEPGQALVEFFATNEELACFVATSSSLRCFRLPLAREQLADRVVAEVTHESRGLLGASLSGLYQLLIAPLLEALRSEQIEHLIIAPHAVLHLLPFGALFDTIEGERRYLLDEFAISYTPSASVMKFALEKITNAEESMLAVNNPDGTLSFADEEVEKIKTLFPDTRVLAREKATREALLSSANQFGLAHFACHGYFRGDAPEQSGLLLADGSLTMLDIINQMELKAWLVTLSACQTAKSRLSGGDEVVGLPRALLYAGAPAVIASLWNVNDRATSILFQQFYAGLKNGASPVSALRAAQIGTRDYEKDGKRPFRDPYYWAAFILIGAGGSVSD